MTRLQDSISELEPIWRACRERVDRQAVIGSLIRPSGDEHQWVAWVGQQLERMGCIDAIKDLGAKPHLLGEYAKWIAYDVAVNRMTGLDADAAKDLWAFLDGESAYLYWVACAIAHECHKRGGK